MIRHVIPIHMKLVILQAILIVVQETWMNNIKIKKTNITSTLHMKKEIRLILNHMKKSGKGYY